MLETQRPYPGWVMLLGGGGGGWGGAKGQVPSLGRGACIWEYASWRSDICLQAEGSTAKEKGREGGLT